MMHTDNMAGLLLDRLYFTLFLSLPPSLPSLSLPPPSILIRLPWKGETCSTGCIFTDEQQREHGWTTWTWTGYSVELTDERGRRGRERLDVGGSRTVSCLL